MSRPPRRFVYRPRTLEDLRQHLSVPPEEAWSIIEDEHGPPKSMTGEALKHFLTTQWGIAAKIFGHDRLSVPAAAVAERVLSDVIDKLRRTIRTMPPGEDRQQVKQQVDAVNREFKRWRAKLPRRPRHRPRKSFARKVDESEAIHEFDLRRRQLQQSGCTRDEAIEQAAERIASKHGVKAATLISWWQHPGRRAPRPRRRRPTTQV
jgi:hypothetical protein